MTLTDLAAIGSFVSGFAVLISLIFLYFQLQQIGMQVRQSERNQQAAIQQTRNLRRIDMFMDRATNPILAEALGLANTRPNDLTMTQWHQVQAYGTASLCMAEDTFYQHKFGFLSNDFFDAWLPTMRATISRPGFRVHWSQSKGTFAPDFVQFMDTLIAAIPPVHRDLERGFADWKSAMEAEVAKAAA